MALLHGRAGRLTENGVSGPGRVQGKVVQYGEGLPEENIGRLLAVVYRDANSGGQGGLPGPPGLTTT